MYGSTYQTFYNLIYKKKYIRSMSKAYQRLNWKFFFYNWNQQTQPRTGLNMTKTYLLNWKLWYFQKKKFISLPINWKKNYITELPNQHNFVKLNSKLNDY